MKTEPSQDFLNNSTSDQRSQIISSWVNLYGDDLYSWASHKVSDDELAQDLIQETYLSAFQSYDTFQGKSNPKTWLFSILNNKIIDHYRRSARSAVRLDLDEERRAVEISDSSFGIDGQWVNRSIHTMWNAEPNLLDNAEFNGVMTKCMDDLPDTWRMTVDAKYILEKDSQEICQELDISPSNYWQVLHRAKLMLKKCIELHWFQK